MIKPAALALALSLAFGALPVLAAEQPIVVELFTSEGCSSCPPADALLAQLAAQPDILALSFHIDYWDGLGWKDPFSSPAATLRQQRYAQILGSGTVYTPQIVVDGRWQAVGSDREAVAEALAAARHAPNLAPLSLTLDHGRARVALGLGAGDVAAEVLLVGFDRQRVDTVARGENAGRTLSHVDVVRGFSEIGHFDHATRTIEAPVPWHADRIAAILQAEDGHILGVATRDLGPL